jgi:RimJ/RimL family protein N-acetyltransferase
MILETKRLYLRYFKESDYKTMLDYRSNEECGRYQMWSARTEEPIKAFLREQQTKTLQDMNYK